MAARRRRSKGDGGGAALLILFAIVVMGLMFINQDLGIMVVAGMIPTLAIGLAEKGRWHAARTQTVGMMNVAGLLVFVFQAFENLRNVEAILFSTMTWIVIWGGAAVGYMFLFVGPFIASKVQEFINAEKIKTLTKQRQLLLDTWGADVLQEKKKSNEPQFIRPKK